MINLEGLSVSQVALLESIASALRAEVLFTQPKASDIVTREFSEDFGNRLVLHHALNADPLKKKAFEFAFAGSSRAVGRGADITRSATNPGQDVVVDGVSFSCKTEASQGIRPDSLTVSKLMEARWIRECLTPEDFANAVKSRVVHHLNQYERIIVLRAFMESSGSAYRYDLVEIPRLLLMEIGRLDGDSFSPRSRNGGSRAEVMIGGRKAFSIVLDGSVEKVTIAGLKASLCVLHGRWVVPIAESLSY